jgi:hypothetical protein
MRALSGVVRKSSVYYCTIENVCLTVSSPIRGGPHALRHSPLVAPMIQRRSLNELVAKGQIRRRVGGRNYPWRYQATLAQLSLSEDAHNRAPVDLRPTDLECLAISTDRMPAAQFAHRKAVDSMRADVRYPTPPDLGVAGPSQHSNRAAAGSRFWAHRGGCSCSRTRRTFPVAGASSKPRAVDALADITHSTGGREARRHEVAYSGARLFRAGERTTATSERWSRRVEVVPVE